MSQIRELMIATVGAAIRRRAPRRGKKRVMTIPEVCAYARDRGITYGRAVQELSGREKK